MSEPHNRPASAKDFVGKQIKPGDVVCYCVRRGSSMWLKTLAVLAVQDTPRGICVSGTSDTGRRIRIYNLDNVVVVESK
jgi:hypothetical protein